MCVGLLGASFGVRVGIASANLRSGRQIAGWLRICLGLGQGHTFCDRPTQNPSTIAVRRSGLHDVIAEYIAPNFAVD